ncbi:MAG: PP2C family protein-serine/threonine phosphatase [Flavobacteriales bacterium]|nr:PP2C family protein-serine/threonine phosphatase [Flavobacteriales bacterium]MBL0043916.1 PP2C family protein-serine/threonine phosphatase [Flavobacteriales bacterium]
MTRLDRINERLNLKEFQLGALLDVTKAINNNLQREELLKLYADIMHDELGITRLMLFEHSGGWRCAHAFGADESQQLVDVRPLIERYKDIQFIGTADEALLTGFDIAVPVFHRELPLALLLIGDIDEEERRVSPAVKHMNFIQTLTNLIAVALENKRLGKVALQQERDKRELELAADMQTMLIPRDLPNDASVQAAAWYLPHRQVGGDYYDLIRINEHELVLCVADVSGKGMAAALLMSNFQATLRAMLMLGYTQLDKLVIDLNELVMERARGERFITLFIGTVDTRTGTIRYVNAGHNAPILWRDGELSELKSGCIALGMLPELPFVNLGEAKVGGGMLMSYTDGLIEQEDIYGAAFETIPLERALRQFSGAGPQAVNEALISTFEAHRAGLPYLDDIALLTCRFA